MKNINEFLMSRNYLHDLFYGVSPTKFIKVEEYLCTDSLSFLYILIIGVSSIVAYISTWYSGTISTIIMLAGFILLNVFFSLNITSTFASQGLELTSYYILYIYGGAIIMLFLLATVAIPKTKIINTRTKESFDKNSDQVLSLAVWVVSPIGTLPYIYNHLSQKIQNAETLLTSVFLNTETAGRSVFIHDVPLASSKKNAILNVAEAILFEPNMYLQASGLLLLALAVVIETMTNDKIFNNLKKAQTKTEKNSWLCY